MPELSGVEIAMDEGLNLTPILIPLLALLVGWAIGFFDSNLRTSKKIKQAEDSAKAAIEAAERKAAQIQAATPNAPASDGDPGLMRIKNENGRLTLDLDGVRMNTSALTAEQRKRLIDMLTAIRPWLEGKPASPPPAIPPQPAPAAAPRAVSSTPPPRPVPPSSASRPTPTTKRKEDEPEAAPTSIVGQINMILQARIAHTPLAARGIALLESPAGGVLVYIGMEKYEGVDAVPDEEVKSAIRAAIAEWETKFTPGL
jgi:hypothetical protein